MRKILLIEDETSIREPLADYLRLEKFEVIESSSFEDAVTQATRQPDLIIIDWMLPDGQGIDLLRDFRREGQKIPIIMLTARIDLIDKVMGLELGANDYITKPFEPRELLARIRVQLRNSESCQSNLTLIEISNISLNISTHEAFFNNKLLDVTKLEFDLLKIFTTNPNQVFSREELLNHVWGYDRYPTTRTVDTHVMQLRQKTRSELFETVHGIGYRFRPTKT